MTDIYVTSFPLVLRRCGRLQPNASFIILLYCSASLEPLLKLLQAYHNRQKAEQVRKLIAISMRCHRSWLLHAMVLSINNRIEGTLPAESGRPDRSRAGPWQISGGERLSKADHGGCGRLEERPAGSCGHESPIFFLFHTLRFYCPSAKDV